MNTHNAYKKVLTHHQGMRMRMRPRTSRRQRQRQAIIGAGISLFIVTFGFVVTLNVSEPLPGRAAINSAIAATEADAVLDAQNFCLTYSSPAVETVEISLIAEDGSDVIKTTQQATKGMNRFEQQGSFAGGTYFVKLKTGSREQIMKVDSN
jgi:hypothetical protein